jgi:hypothetical protein
MSEIIISTLRRGPKGFLKQRVCAEVFSLRTLNSVENAVQPDPHRNNQRSLKTRTSKTHRRASPKGWLQNLKRNRNPNLHLAIQGATLPNRNLLIQRPRRARKKRRDPEALSLVT